MKKTTPQAKTVLLVEDDLSLSKLIAIELQARGFTVLLARDGEEALEQLKNGPDLIWLDLYMPKVDGLEFLAQMKKDPIHAKIPVVVVTVSRSKAEIAQHLPGVNMVGYFLKSSHPLANIVNEVEKKLSNGMV